VCAQYFEGQDLKSALQQHLNEIYPIARDDQALRACLKEGWSIKKPLII
jgi:erythronate-4-phosphate dehydrogenase